MKRFVEYLKSRLRVRHVVSESSLSFLRDSYDQVCIDRKPLRLDEHCLQFTFCTDYLVGSVGSGAERRFCDGRDRKFDGSTPTQASLLRPWIRCFAKIIPAW